MSVQTLSHRDKELEEQIVEYLEEKPMNKTTISSREINSKFTFTEKEVGDTLKHMEENRPMIGEKLPNCWARWEVNR